MTPRDPTERFSDRVDDYVRYRPHYPTAVRDYLRDEAGLTAAATVADVGSGTGILSEPFLKNGNRVFGVEPNAAMRAAAEALLAHYPNFVSVDGTAEATTLPDDHVDFVTAGQAFHWFDQDKARAEFRRILRPEGVVALVWNTRDVAGSPFMQQFEALMARYGTDYHEVCHKGDEAALHAFFADDVRQATFANEQLFDLEGLKGRTLSSSYAPLAGHPNHAPLTAALEDLFQRHAENGRIRFLYRTKLYVGRPRE